MRLVIQRVNQAEVQVQSRIVGSIGKGLLVLVGVHHSDTADDAVQLARKTSELRIFSDEEGRFNLSLKDVNGSILAVSQFTLLADTRRGRRPSFAEAARPEQAEPMFELFCQTLTESGLEVERGVFGASMEVSLSNSGPVTLVLDSDEFREPRRSRGRGEVS